KDLLQEQIDLLDKEADRVNDYYDKLIAGTEKQYDAMVKGMEEYRSQFEELLDLFENARLEATLSELGVNMDALLNGSQEEFEKMKGAYIGILADMSRGNEEMIGQLSRLAGVNAESVSYLESTKGTFDKLGSVTLVNDITFPEISDEGYAQKLRGIAQAFGEIASKCGEFKKINFSSIIGSASAPSTDGAVMSGGEGMEGTAGTGFLGLASAISEAVASIDEQMGKLKTALDLGNSYFTGQIDVINEKYIPAWENLRTCLAEIVGVGGGDSGDKKGRGKQETGSTGSGSASGGKPGSIIDIMQTGGDAVDAKLEDPWLKAFNDFATDGDNSIQTICDKIIEIVTEMARIIQEKCEAAASALNSLAETASASLSSAGGFVSGGTVSVTPYAEGTVGNAFANGTGGYKGLPHDEKNALRSEYGQPELTVYPDGKAELTTEPVMSDLPKGTVIFNEEQTRQIMNNKGEVVEAYKSGTVRMSDGTVITPEGKVHYPLTPSDRTYQMMKKFEEYFAANKDAFIKPANAMNNAAEVMKTVIETINNNNTMNRNINVDVGGVHVHGVQNPEEFSDVVNLRIHNKILQEMHKY
ncbi:MAG: phage tail tape measure protein, partial [Lachnospiraceae bacterium]|nr:phage tail tape measure protein [Lachnospiraceae bacterium]